MPLFRTQLEIIVLDEDEAYSLYALLEESMGDFEPVIEDRDLTIFHVPYYINGYVFQIVYDARFDDDRAAKKFLLQADEAKFMSDSGYFRVHQCYHQDGIGETETSCREDFNEVAW